MNDITLESLLADGFTRRMANSYLNAIKWENESGLFDADFLEWAHSNGFRAESVAGYDLENHDISEYMKDYEYAKIWPLNSWQRIWINDKLTLKYMLAGTPLGHYMPKYYFYTDATRMVPLPDGDMNPSMDAFFEVLDEVGAFACKPCNGYGASGFHVMTADAGAYTLDGKEVPRADIEDFVRANPNYLYTEFLSPEESLARISPSIHTLRFLVINPDGAHPVPIANYLRFGVKAGTEGTLANYRAPIDSSMCSYNCTVNMDTGELEGGRLVYANRTVSAAAHPDSGCEVSGMMPYWDETRAMVRDVAAQLGPLEYLGFDIGVTADGPKIMEINSYSGLPYIQLFTPLLAHDVAGPFFCERIAAVDGLDEAGKLKRNAIMK